MLHKYLKWTLPVLSTLLLQPAMVTAGSQFDNWWDSVTNCPECASIGAFFYGNRSGLLASPTEKREIVLQFPSFPSGSSTSLVQCADPTPVELNQGDVNRGAEWVKTSILNAGGRVNDDSGSDHQVTAADQIDLNDPTEMIELARHGAQTMVVDTSNTMGVVTKCAGGNDIQFIGKNGKPLVNSNGEGKAVIDIPPECPKKLASQRKVRNALSGNGADISRCAVCRDDTSRFVLKQEFAESLAQMFQVRVTTLYSAGVLPNYWMDRRERLYQDELDGILPGIIEACRKNPAGGGDTDGRKSNRFFDCAEYQYSTYFPGPSSTQTFDDGYGNNIYFRYYALYQCGPCGQYGFESYLATYQGDVYYGFDGYWEYLASLDDALAYICPGW